MKITFILLIGLACFGLLLISGQSASVGTRDASRTAAPGSVAQRPTAPALSAETIHDIMEEKAGRMLSEVDWIPMADGGVIAWANVGGPYVPGYVARLDSKGQVRCFREGRPIHELQLQTLRLPSGDRPVLLIRDGGGIGVGYGAMDVRILDANDFDITLWKQTVGFTEIIDHFPRHTVESHLVFDLASEQPRILWHRVTVQGPPVDDDNRWLDQFWKAPQLEVLEVKWNEEAGRFGEARLAPGTMFTVNGHPQ